MFNFILYFKLTIYYLLTLPKKKNSIIIFLVFFLCIKHKLEKSIIVSRKILKPKKTVNFLLR